jgi:hypothetical protein
VVLKAVDVVDYDDEQLILVCEKPIDLLALPFRAGFGTLEDLTNEASQL